MDAALSEMPDFRNKRSVWHMSTEGFNEAHFATFPTALVEPCIKAGTSEYGCCPKCLAPWERCARLGAGVKQWRPSCDCYAEDYLRELPQPRRSRERLQRGLWGGREIRVLRRPGLSTWPVVRAVVLDPFGGAGTTGLVADRLPRAAILLELNEKYAGMARDRINKEAPLFAAAE